MKNFIFVLMTVAYSMLSSFLFWLFFKWITPYVMNASWIMLLLYPFLALGDNIGDLVLPVAVFWYR